VLSGAIFLLIYWLNFFHISKESSNQKNSSLIEELSANMHLNLVTHFLQSLRELLVWTQTFNFRGLDLCCGLVGEICFVRLYWKSFDLVRFRLAVPSFSGG
jgi:hypothetical protein